MNKSISFDDLPSVFGEDADQNFVDFFNQLEISNFPTQRVKNYYYYQIGRWDLQLFNNQTIKFPSEKIINAIQQSVELLKRKNFNDYNTIINTMLTVSSMSTSLIAAWIKKQGFVEKINEID